MTEDEACHWFVERFEQAKVDRISQFLDMVIAENQVQNLISPASVEHIWSRHAVDSAQLLGLAEGLGTWIDIGTGGGFPGLIVGLLREGKTILVEPRKRRAAFLQNCIDELGCAGHMIVEATKVQSVSAKAAVISARAVSTIENILLAAMHCATEQTRWLLPRGHMSDGEISMLGTRWKGMFHVEHSITAIGSVIVVADGVRAR